MLRIFLLLLSIPLSGASPWSESHGARLRVLAGPREGAIHWAGLEIALDSGWKTYWRMPGDSGIPPRIDSSGSVNLAALDVVWPAPMRLRDAAGTSIGYSASPLVLPLRITPIDPKAPVILDLNIQYGICKDLCVPADGKGRVILFAAGPDAAAILAAKARAPKESDGLAAAGGFGVTAARIDGPVLTMEVFAAEAPAGSIDLFVEGPQETTLSVPERVAGETGRARFRLKIDRLREDQRSAFVFTVTAPGRSITQRWRP